MAHTWASDLGNALKLPPHAQSVTAQLYTERHVGDNAIIKEIERLQGNDRDGDYQPLVATIATLNRENEALVNQSTAELQNLRTQNAELATQLQQLQGKYDKAGQALISSIAGLITSQRKMKQALSADLSTP